MRVYVYPEMEKKHAILVVPSPAAKKAPTVFSGATRDEALQKLRDHLAAPGAETSQTSF